MPSKLRESARGEACTLRFFPYCNQDPETTVLCHFDSAIMGGKGENWFGAYGCSTCHDIVDGRNLRLYEFDADDVAESKLRALKETWKRMIELGLIEVKD